MNNIKSDCGCPESQECCETKKCCCPIDIVLNAAVGGLGPLPVIAIGDATQAISVVSVTIDASSVLDPSVLLKFTTQISLPTEIEEEVTATLSFGVLRTDNNSGTPVSIGPAFTYSITAVALETDSFAFQLFDSDLNSAAYTYSVVLLPTAVVTLAGVTLINSTLSALAVSGVNQ